MLQKHFWKIFVLVAILCIGGAYIYSTKSSGDANEGVVLGDHIKGNPDGLVSLTEYSDFQCPACGQFRGVISDVMDEYGDYVRFEYKHFPLITIHQNSLLAARAAEAAAQQDKFWEMHDKLFINQNTWGPSRAPQTFFNQYAQEIGLDMNLYKQHMRSSMIEDEVLASFEEAKNLGLTGTPSLFLNGEKMNFSTYQEFADQISEAVNAAYFPEGAAEEQSSTTVSEEVSVDAVGDEAEFGFEAN